MQCPNGQVCVNNACADAACFGVVCSGGQTCAQGICGAAHCSDGMLDGDETDVDCGGSCPNTCAPAQGCMTATDCSTGNCMGGHCAQAASCTDGKRDGTETDIDCGGTDCTLRCAIGSGCLVGTDCTSDSCSGGVCVGPSCSDGKKNGSETDVDCGGVCTQKCADGKHCSVPADCSSAACVAGVCTTSSCSDGLKDGTESDVDCGGSCPLRCSTGQLCALPSDCTSMTCVSGMCGGATCTDGVKNGSETDVDCGGSCTQKCANGKHCSLPSDCVSMSCLNGVCAGSSCTDGVKNGNETDIDCGGSCAPCASGLHCSGTQDCQSGVCGSTVCQAPTCTDMVKNGTETDVDCGGSCPKCADGQMCSMPSDCANGFCSGTICASSSCFDSLKDGNETDIDCGGSCARKCNVGQGCMIPGDCGSGVCTANVCAGDPLYTGLLGWWPLNTADIANTAVIDATGRGNTAILVGGFASAPGKIGGAIQFTGANSFLNAGDDINPSLALTLSAWINAMPIGGNQVIFSKWCTSGNCGDNDQSFILQVTSTGAAQCYANGTNNGDYNITGGAVADGTWHLVTCTVDRNGTGPNHLLYVDGAQVAAETVGANFLHVSVDPLVIGSHINGMLDDVRIYGRALSPSEVLTLSSMTYPGVPAAPTALTATAVAGPEIDLSWTASPSTGVSGYVIERSLTGTNGWFPIAVVQSGTTTYADVTIPGATKFYYRVSAQSPTDTSSPASVANATSLAGPAYSIPTGLLAYWTANSADISGPSETDASGGGAAASLVGGPTSIAGRIREGLQLSGTSYLSVSNAPNPQSGITLSAWIKSTQTTTANLFDRWCINGCADSDQQFLVQMSRQAGTGFITVYFNGLGGGDYNVTGRIIVNDGQWHLITVTGDAAAFGNNMKIYVDGALDIDTAVGSDIIHFTTDPVQVGSSYIGIIDDMRMYNRGLTSTEIRALYANGNIGSP
jgi:hypothetical protein